MLPVAMAEKFCGTCREFKSPLLFSKNISAKDGLQTKCKSCAVKATLDWERKNPEKKRAAQRLYSKRHRKLLTQKAMKWAADNPDKVKGAKSRYMKSHPDKNLEWISNRRARKLNAPGYASATAIRARVDYYGGRCYMCGSAYQHIDHVIPISKGGSNWPANLRPACAPCNMRKHDKPMRGTKWL